MGQKYLTARDEDILQKLVYKKCGWEKFLSSWTEIHLKEPAKVLF